MIQERDGFQPVLNSRHIPVPEGVQGQVGWGFEFEGSLKMILFQTPDVDRVSSLDWV